MEKLNCLVCKSEVRVENDVMTGEIVECSSCGQELEIQTVNGVISVGLAPEIEETWGE